MDANGITIPKGKRDKGGGAKKYGRNKAKCQRYRLEGRREKNRMLRLARAIKRKEKLARLRQKRGKKAA